MCSNHVVVFCCPAYSELAQTAVANVAYKKGNCAASVLAVLKFIDKHWDAMTTMTRQANWAKKVSVSLKDSVLHILSKSYGLNFKLYFVLSVLRNIFRHHLLILSVM